MRNRVLVRHLLSYLGLPDMLPKNVELRRSHATLDEFVKAQSKHLYNSSPILISAIRVRAPYWLPLLLRVSGESLRDFQQRRIFSPLNMRSSSLGLGGRSVKDLVWCGTASADKRVRMNAVGDGIQNIGVI